MALADECVRRADFRDEPIPVFTKHGCNAETCHGAAIGRDGVGLPLYGGDAGADYGANVRLVGGRPVLLSAPTRSLIVLKPTEFIEHVGERCCRRKARPSSCCPTGCVKMRRLRRHAT